MEEAVCPKCKTPVDETMFFCPSCGRKLKDKPPGTGVWQVAGLLAMCMFLPPFNVPLSVRYIRSADQKAKLIGWISLGVMAATLIFVTWWTVDAVNKANEEINKQFGQYQMLGY